MKHLRESKMVQLNPEFFEELSSVEDLLVVKGGNVPPPQNSDCGCTRKNRQTDEHPNPRCLFGLQFAPFLP